MMTCYHDVRQGVMSYDHLKAVCCAIRKKRRQATGHLGESLDGVLYRVNANEPDLC